MLYLSISMLGLATSLIGFAVILQGRKTRKRLEALEQHASITTEQYKAQQELLRRLRQRPKLDERKVDK